MRKRKVPNRFSGALFLLVMGAFHCWAQFSSAIAGTVTDASGAVVPNAEITVQNVATGASLEGLTTDAGYFRFNALPAALYLIKVASSGLQTAVHENIRLEISETKTVNISLTLGAVATKAVTVTSEPAIVEMGNARVSHFISEQRLHEVPMAGSAGHKLHGQTDINRWNGDLIGPVNGDLVSPLFGRSTSTFPGRNVQLGLRFEF